MTNLIWRRKRLPLEEWSFLQEKFGELQLSSGGPEDLAMFIKSMPGDIESEIYITGPNIEIIERHSLGGWEDCEKPSGDNVSLLVGSGDPWEYFDIERPMT